MQDDNWCWRQLTGEGLWGLTVHVSKRVYTYNFGLLSKCGYFLVWWEFIASEHLRTGICSAVTQQKVKRALGIDSSFQLTKLAGIDKKQKYLLSLAFSPGN